MSDIVRELKVQNYGCVRDASVSLTPLHALIGPNDSGKSTLLRALRTAVQLAGQYFSGYNAPFDAGFNTLVSDSAEDFLIEMAWLNLLYRVRGPIRYGGTTFNVQEQILLDKKVVSDERRDASSRSALSYPRLPSPTPEAFRSLQRGAHMLRLDPDALRGASELIPANRAAFRGDRGQGLAGIYDIILNQKVAGFLAIQEKVRALFPGIKAIGLQNVSSSTKVLQA